MGNLSELVYKQGQAGVTKASVTVVFNNEAFGVEGLGVWGLGFRVWG